MLPTRLKYVVWDIKDGGSYVVVSEGYGVFTKKDGFRNCSDAEAWVARQVRKEKLKQGETKLFDTPWLTSRLC